MGAMVMDMVDIVDMFDMVVMVDRWMWWTGGYVGQVDIVDKWTNQTWWIGCTCPHMVVKGGWQGEPVGYV